YNAYKAQRPAKRSQRPADWHQRLDRLRGALSGLLPSFLDPVNEADIEIARYLRHAHPGRALIVSTDRDFLMLLGDQVDVWRPGLTPELYQLADFEHEYGFAPCRFPVFKALVGDRSDNISGVRRLPSKVAKRLAAAFPTVEA